MRRVHESNLLVKEVRIPGGKVLHMNQEIKLKETNLYDFNAIGFGVPSLFIAVKSYRGKYAHLKLGGISLNYSQKKGKSNVRAS